jgi:hypothetical protein
MFLNLKTIISDFRYKACVVSLKFNQELTNPKLPVKIAWQAVFA